MNIKFGDKSNEVNSLQQKLKQLGYDLDTDGDFGSGTLLCVNNFQKLNKLIESKEVDSIFLNLLDSDVDFNSKIDPPSLLRIMSLHPKIRFEVLHLFKECFKKGLKIRVVQGYRTFAEQDELYAQGRTKPGPIVTKAKGGLSNHNYGLAFDFCLLKSDGSITWSLTEDLNDDGNKDWMQVVQIFKECGYDWGGDWKFKDNPHLEKMFGKSIRELLSMHNSGKVDKNNYVII